MTQRESIPSDFRKKFNILALAAKTILWQFQCTSTNYITRYTFLERPAIISGYVQPVVRYLFIFLLPIQKHILLSHIVTKCAHVTILQINTKTKLQLFQMFIACTYNNFPMPGADSPAPIYIPANSTLIETGCSLDSTRIVNLSPLGFNKISSENLPPFMPRFTTILARYL